MGGRRSKEDLDTEYWVAGDGLAKVEEWLKQGLYDKQIANNIGVTPQSVKMWKKQHPAFGLLFKQARKTAVIELVNEMFEAAKNRYVEEEVLDLKGNVKTIKKYMKGDTRAQEFLLKNWSPDRYKDKHDIELSGALPIILTGEDDLKD